MMSDERRNYYKIPQERVGSPLAPGFIELAQFFEKKPQEILAGAFTPFRTHYWETLPQTKKAEAILFGHKFWHETLRRKSLELIVTRCHHVKEAAEEIIGADLDDWTMTSPAIERLRSKSGKTIFFIPYRFDLPELEQRLRPLL